MSKLTQSHFAQQRCLWVILFVFVIWIALHMGAVVNAATITVNSLNDSLDGTCQDTECTLRDAIKEAETGDTIVFSVTGTITLEESSLFVDKGLTISGPGPSQLVIETEIDSSSGVFTIANMSGIGCTICGMTITGSTTNGFGGGITNYGGTLILSDCVITGNTAELGGGIYTEQPIKMINCTVSGNTASHNGGGIFSHGMLEINDSTVINNTASHVAGGIYINYNTAIINNSTISDNTAGGGGGGIVIDDMANMALNDCLISGNTANHGGGIFNFIGSTELNNSTVSGNTVTSDGGGIKNDTGSLTVIGSIVSGNEAGNDGGGIFDDSGLRLFDCMINDNIAGNHGGGIAILEGAANILRTNIINNTAERDGGGLYSWEGFGLNITDSIVSDNIASNQGGGIAVIGHYGAGDYSNNTTILRTTISNNIARCCGGGILKAGDESMTIDMSTIANNRVNDDEPGGGIFAEANSDDDPSIDIISSTIYGNSAGQAGGVALDAGQNTIMNSTISGNIAIVRGGGIGYCCDLILVNTILAMNTAPIGPDCNLHHGATSLGNNIIGDLSGCPIVPLSIDIIGDPGIGTFFDTGIPGQGHIPLLSSSAAIDSGNDSICPPTDQLGTLRPQDGDGDGNAISDIGAYEFVLTYIEVEIDIKPGGVSNSINLKSKGKVPVAVLTTDDFDAYTIEAETVTFAGANPLRWSMEDVDNDGDDDMLLHFMTQELELTEEVIEASLEGETYDGTYIMGTESVRIVPNAKLSSNGKKKNKKM